MTAPHPSSVLPALTSLALATAALGQAPFLSNQSNDPYIVPLATGPTTASGSAAPAGAAWSELQSDATGANAVGGQATHPSSSGAFRLADNFTVAGHPWQVDRIAFFAYQPGATSNPFASVNLRIWRGRPGDPGSTIVFGDTTTNRLESVTSTNLYRVFSSATQPFPTPPDTTKLIWKLVVAAGPTTLPPADYWLDWQIVPANPANEAFTPTITTPSTRTQPGANARQLTPTGWIDVLDAGKPASAPDVAVDFPFVLYGYQGQPPCNADFDGDGDTATDADIEAFFRCLAGNCCPTCGPADFDADGDYATDADIEAFFRVLAGRPC